MITVKEIKKLLRHAIAEGIIVEFYYHGGMRRVEPYAYGVHKESGNEVVSAYQIGGYSKSKKMLRWRMYLLKNIKDVRLTDEIFDLSNRPHYQPKDSRMSLVYCRKEK
ncbi:hypothetical protein ACFL3D_02695 [Candidatus Omnitrophota bacterium]